MRWEPGRMGRTKTESGGEELDILQLPWSPGTSPGCPGFSHRAFPPGGEAGLWGWESNEEEGSCFLHMKGKGREEETGFC